MITARDLARRRAWKRMKLFDKIFQKRLDELDARREFESRPVTDPAEWDLLIPMAREYCGIPATEPVTETRALGELRVAVNSKKGLMLPRYLHPLLFRFTENTYKDLS